jgi:hypothetical protein
MMITCTPVAASFRPKFPWLHLNESESNSEHLKPHKNA